MAKLTPKQKIDKITDEWVDKGKRYKNLTPYEMNMLMNLYYFGELITFDSSVAKAAESIGFKVKLDEQGINYEISL